MQRAKNSDVLIIGGGVIGLALARALRKKGAGRVTILERGAAAGAEASSAAAGMLAPNAESERVDDFQRFCADSSRLYPQFAAELRDETGIDIELERHGTLYLAFGAADSEEIRRRFAWQKKAGLNVERLPPEDVRRIEPFVSPDVREALFFPEDWQVENRLLVKALLKFAELNDVEIKTGAEARNLIIENGKVIGAQTAHQTFFAEKTVLAAGAWTSLVKIPGFDASLPEIVPVRGQMIGFQTAKRLFFHVIYSPRGYVVPRLDGRILVGATVERAGFDKGVTEEGVYSLRRTAAEIAPSLEKIPIAEKWAGLRPFAADGLPVLGGVPEIENLFVAAAHFRNGILLAPLTADVLAADILNRTASGRIEAFSPQRFRLARAG